MRRLPSLDGLRGIACLAVIAFHANNASTSGGWLGVDVFFVVSGYVITGLLLAEWETLGGINLARFWLRRAGRLYPALLVATAVVIDLAASGVHEAAGTRNLGPLMAVTYLADWWRAIGNSGGLIDHTWSLAIEEQFYLAWPLLVLACKRVRNVFTVAVAGAAASLTAMIVLSPGQVLTQHPYSAPYTRAWELLAGCALAAAVRRWTVPGWVLTRGGWLGTVLGVGVWGVATALNRLVTWLAVAMVAATVVVLASCPGRSRPVRALEWAPLRWVGQRSYGAYLYHFPIVVLLTDSLPWPWMGSFGVSVVATLACAAISYRWVEAPIRRWVGTRTSPATAIPHHYLREGC